MQQKAQGKYQANVAEQNAALVRNQQADAIEKANQDRVRLDRKYAQLQGSQQTAFAANGIDANFGSAKQTAEDTATLRGDDATSLYLNEKDELGGLDINAANYKSQAQAARMRGNAAMTSSLFQAGGTILGGVSQYAKYQSS